MNLSPSLSYEEIFNQLCLAEGDCMANVVLARQQKLETGMRDSAASCLLSPPLLIVNVVTSCCCCHRLRRAQTETDRERLVVSYLSSRETTTELRGGSDEARDCVLVCLYLVFCNPIRNTNCILCFLSPSSYTGYELLRLQREH